MRSFLVTLVFGLATAMPHDGSQVGFIDEGKGEFGVMLFYACAMDNWRDEIEFDVNIRKVSDCNKCVQKIQDPVSAKGLEESKYCLTNYLQTLNQACGQFIDAVKPGDPEKVGDGMIWCILGNMRDREAQRCLDMTSGDSVTDHLTEAVLCMKDSSNNGTELLEYMAGLEHGDHSNEIVEHTVDHHELMEELMPQAYCQAALNGDDNRAMACKECMINAEDLKQGQQCYNQYIRSKFQECDAGLNDLVNGNSEDEAAGKQVMKCFNRILARDLMEQCTDNPTEATAEVLANTWDCVKSEVMKLIKKNAGPTVMALLDHDDSHEHGSDEEGSLESDED